MMKKKVSKKKEIKVEKKNFINKIKDSYNSFRENPKETLKKA